MSGRSKDIASFRKIVLCTPSGTAFEPCRGVIASAAGTIDCITVDGNSITGLTVVAGVNPYQLNKISAATPTIWLGY